MQKWFNYANWSASRKLSTSFLIVILIGSLLLSLPIAHQPGVRTTYLDHLFTSVSMVCVTGLSVITVSDTYNLFGQLIGICLMQIGGLGLITLISISFFSLKRRISLSNHYTLQEALNQNSTSNLRAFLFAAYRITILTELVAACVLMTDFIPRYGWFDGIFNAFFIAVSAFCNAGFDNLGASSLQQFALNPTINFTIATLIILGGIGFPVWINLCDTAKKFATAKPRHLHLASRQLTSHTRLVLMVSALLLVSGTLLTWLSEMNNPQTIGSFNFWQQGMASFFQTVTMRTAGFSTLNYELTTPFTNLMYMLHMFIGGAPGGTAGGIKVTTAAIMFLVFRSELSGYTHTVFHFRSIPAKLVKQALTIILFFFTLMITGYALLLFTQPHLESFALLFETVSAIATVGVSMNLTPELTTVGRIIVMCLMFIGRVGPFTVFLSLLQKEHKSIQYADTEILIG
ncbi:TrkH family potassium uptake protein [Aerococcaceae bacterium NML190073]|nr:TrkH family potassium uptake protein [Aerococcaceae bacterium NML190073]